MTAAECPTCGVPQGEPCVVGAVGWSRIRRSRPHVARERLAAAPPPAVRILVNDNVTMSPRKMAAQAVHAALEASGVEHGRVVVLGGTPSQIQRMPYYIEDAGRTEVKPGTITAGAALEPGE